MFFDNFTKFSGNFLIHPGQQVSEFYKVYINKIGYRKQSTDTDPIVVKKLAGMPSECLHVKA